MVARALTQHLATTSALLVALCLLVLPVASDGAKALVTEDFVDGQIIVRLDPGVPISEINSRYNTRVQERFLNQANTNVYLLKVTDGSSAATKLEEILKDPKIKYAELNYLSEAPEANTRHRAFPSGDATPTTKNYSRPSSNDPSSYDESALKLAAAQKISMGAGTTVAVIDTGAQMTHPALKARFVGVPRYDFVSDDRDPSEPALASTDELQAQEVVGHGTHVAGIVHLVAPKAGLMPLRALNRDGSGSVFHIAEATTFADTNGADVINLSLGTPSWSKLLREKVKEATDHGSVVVAAAGNDNSPVQQYPASRSLPAADPDDGLLAVTSVDPNESKSDFANYGAWVDIAAPGREILSTYPVSRYAYWSGTSMATPFVSGEAAQLRSQDNRLDPSGVEMRIRRGARCLEEDPTHSKLGAGHADFYNSLKNIQGRSCTLLPPV